ncbi:hypothetical protein MPTK1_3g14940 [Marchantia polymorpha subsp. ruderalis]|uniref:Uncharacterized protein n=2 Tax=Marchantia polymorpha TaxID=3197 RepID=A0AAF6B0X7_MARPO|nr:hypothetical protein MARPO_0004s0178 [Marchantia polymorpha]BBN05661.1 hypothetical protein Mp_3g14940 [Marchantia polymorpha subsp. ruderalis]|eukprot:PTQ48921.1 hypothetical protein MARPO_0004s0178 [Marchantia polymorpha]
MTGFCLSGRPGLRCAERRPPCTGYRPSPRWSPATSFVPRWRGGSWECWECWECWSLTSTSDSPGADLVLLSHSATSPCSAQTSSPSPGPWRDSCGDERRSNRLPQRLPQRFLHKKNFPDHVAQLLLQFASRIETANDLRHVPLLRLRVSVLSLITSCSRRPHKISEI